MKSDEATGRTTQRLIFWLIRNATLSSDGSSHRSTRGLDQRGPLAMVQHWLAPSISMLR
jgi:hypothetical protein